MNWASQLQKRPDSRSTRPPAPDMQPCGAEVEDIEPAGAQQAAQEAGSCGQQQCGDGGCGSGGGSGGCGSGGTAPTPAAAGVAVPPAGTICMKCRKAEAQVRGALCKFAAPSTTLLVVGHGQAGVPSASCTPPHSHMCCCPAAPAAARLPTAAGGPWARAAVPPLPARAAAVQGSQRHAPARTHPAWRHAGSGLLWRTRLVSTTALAVGASQPPHRPPRSWQGAWMYAWAWAWMGA